MMTSFLMVAGGVLLFAGALCALVVVSRTVGRASAKIDTLEEGEDRRDAFDEVVSRPSLRGRRLVDKLRRELGR